jgi:hypothetical protein
LPFPHCGRRPARQQLQQRAQAKQCEGRAGWSVVKLACSHDVMVDMPRELADVLAGLA